MSIPPRKHTEGDELANVVQQESALVFDRFGEDVAFAIGAAIRAQAISARSGIVIDIRLWDRPLFFVALEGSAGSHSNWSRRKINVVRMFHKSSYRMALEQQSPNRIFPSGYGLDPADYALAGGAFPVRLRNIGVIGAIAVSGLSEREDHESIVAALQEYLGREAHERVPR